ncbi:hypothetical protein JCM9803A_11890 [Rhodococcus erythropolis]
MAMPDEVYQIVAPQDLSRAFAAILHAKRGDIEGVSIVIDEANERNRLAELTFATLFSFADIFRKNMGKDFEAQMLDLTAHAASFGKTDWPSDV